MNLYTAILCALSALAILVLWASLELSVAAQRPGDRPRWSDLVSLLAMVAGRGSGASDATREGEKTP